jgi:hypothetical protein
LLAKADALQAEGKTEEAREIYVQLSVLPIEGEAMDRVRAAARK